MFAILMLTFALGAAPDDLGPIREMLRAANAVEDYTAILVKREARDGELEPEQRLAVKWARPQRLYLKSLGPDAPGQEVLYVRGENRDRVKVDPSSFPWITLNLDPRGRWAMARTHHPIDTISLPNLARLVGEDALEAAERGDLSLRPLGDDRIDETSCRRFELRFPDRTRRIVMKRGETLWTIADRTGRTMHSILQRNRDRRWSAPDDPNAGDDVLVPMYHGARIELCLDRESALPLRVFVDDHAGRPYERYEHRSLEIDVGLTDADFDPDNPDYGF